MNPSAVGILFRVTVIGLLAVVAFELHRIESRMPPTRADLIAASSDDERTQLLQKAPLVGVSGSVDVTGSEVRVSGSVDVDNRVRLSEPVTVVIER
jgi:hypothetical protein